MERVSEVWKIYTSLKTGVHSAVQTYIGGIFVVVNIMDGQNPQLVGGFEWFPVIHRALFISTGDGFCPAWANG